MAEVQAILVFTPSTLEPGGPTLTVGRTRAVGVLRAVRDTLLAEAAQEARMWRDLDPTLGAMREAESERLVKLLALVLPDEALQPDLRVVREQG
jgi:hypothetical protein